ncbi:MULTISPECIES: 16S rRNA pseudouridine(516) synthase RsuA [Gilliamella]|uniref:Pseudouridine synthase n=1 Tax=Gilliamella apis TaxID=1970738 RepID=A0A242NVQ1_9GAMM|nr:MULTISPECIES: 16S rRNA pseudouridine(516) synthase RsuA [Gilliamella]MBI0153677.1 16S rRNA pseudouridine(516) synthase RsuA [Gilliamella sp. W8128]MBI0157514.1 16S rRNA pseudouridine(516) synthase RsuA [Gilliamella sp. M0364]MCT6884997.1 16S rRNA pseudouridine(516) synthase RsuA [Gilliamella apis]OCG09532.1 16S rRNA pseudouridine(516) synthase [Gilliamella apis]OTQ50389.1 16S rRNA pseudouridine(516) synthase [Gilliamella apis]
MRLDKFLAHHLGVSRTIVNKELKAQKVTVNGDIVKSGAYHISPDQIVEYDGFEIVPITENRYFMLNKPQGYVCSTDDPDHPTILYFIDEPMAEKLHSAGRLDLDTTGLVLLTDDGKWSHRITSPKHHCEKVYQVTVEQPLTANLIDIFKQGIQLKSEKTLTEPAKLIIIDDYHAELTISEGRYHQVKRMFAAVNNHVTQLHRKQIGNIVLNIPEGEYRPLTQDEINSFN